MEMTDKELLEKAAKAAGLKIDRSKTNGGGMNNTGFDMSGNAVLDWHNYKVWNPLTNDGDCARLEASLCIDVQWLDYSVAAYIKDEDGMLIHEFEEVYSKHDSDKNKSRRIASTRAAAAMAR